MDELPAPQQEKELPAPPEEKELPAPKEKLLRAPTFWEKTNKMRLAIVLLFFLAILLTIPVPYFQPILPCMPCIENNPAKCKPCPPEGWHLGDPLWKILSRKLAPAPLVQVSPDAIPTSYPTVAQTVQISPKLSCRPRPACLDSIPRCRITETPDMCPPSKLQETVMCTMDAKQCPDGSWVGRTGPKCEFSPCPGKVNK